MNDFLTKKMREKISSEPQTGIATGRIDAALEASYEIETLALNLPEHVEGDISSEYIRRLFKRRIKVLAGVVTSALTDDRKTDELRRIVGLKIVEAADD